MEFKGTKDWFYEPRNGENLVCYKKIAGWDTVCMVDSWGLSREQVIANTKLIAAAPDLVYVLKMARIYLMSSGAKIDGPVISDIDRVLIKALG